MIDRAWLPYEIASAVDWGLECMGGPNLSEIDVINGGWLISGFRAAKDLLKHKALTA